MEDVVFGGIFSLIVLFFHNIGMIPDMWAITLVFGGFLIVLAKCGLDVCYLPRSKVIYRSGKRRRKRQEA